MLVQGQHCQPKSSLFSTYPKKQEKISFYLITEQAEKFDDLAYKHEKQISKCISRNTIIYHPINTCSIENPQDLK